MFSPKLSTCCKSTHNLPSELTERLPHWFWASALVSELELEEKEHTTIHVMGKGTGAPRAAAVVRRHLGTHLRALILRSIAACHAKGLFVFAASWGQHSSGAKQTQSLGDTRSLN